MVCLSIKINKKRVNLQARYIKGVLMTGDANNNGVEATSNKKYIIINKITAILILILGIIFIIPPTIGFLRNSLNIQFVFLELKLPELFFELVNKTGLRQFGVLCFIACIFLCVAIYKNIKKKKYKLHAFSGMLGLLLSLISILLIIFFEEPLLVFLFVIAGLLCSYCISVPIYAWCFNRFKEKKWEPLFIIAVLGSILTYFLTGFSAIVVNEIFTINAKYFSYTVPIVIFLLLTPIIAILSLCALCWLLWKEFRSTKVDSDTFYNLNKMMTCYILMSVSMAYSSNPMKLLEVTSSAFDFDPVSPCDFEDSYDGYIILDPAHTKVLTYSKGKPSPYTVRECKLK